MSSTSRRVRRRRAVVCQQLVELVDDYLSGDLDEAVREAVELHLAGCGDCAGYVAQVRTMLTLTSTLDRTEQLPPDLVDSLAARFTARSS